MTPAFLFRLAAAAAAAAAAALAAAAAAPIRDVYVHFVVDAAVCD